jgi:hypothetical protein
MRMRRDLGITGLVLLVLATHSSIALGDVVDPVDAVDWPNHVLFSRTDATGTHIFRVPFIPDDGQDITPVQLTFGDGADEEPAWLPDASGFTFTKRVPGDPPALWTADATGANVEPFIRNAFDAEWSPDGQHVAFARTRARNTDIWVATADGSTLLRLTSDSAVDRAPTWSRDGATLAFESDRTGSPLVFLMDADGTHERPVAREREVQRDPAWSPTGGLFIARGPSRDADIWHLRLANSRWRRMVSTTTADASPSSSLYDFVLVFAGTTARGVSRLYQLCYGCTRDLVAGLMTVGAGFDDRDPAIAPWTAWVTAHHAYARARLDLAVHVASSIYAREASYADAADTWLISIEEATLFPDPEFWRNRYVNHTVTDDFEQVAITHVDGVWGATTRSYDGVCFYARLEGGAAAFGSEPMSACDANDSLAVNDPSW